jgi:hypothetical protein
MNAIAGSAAGWEMAVRLGQSLEITDALWELAPVVVAAGERVDERPAVQAADLSPAARGLDSSDRARLQALGDQFIATLDAAVAEQRIDEEALRSLTPTEVMADPFGTIGALLDLPTYLQQALPAAAGLASLSSREMLYLVAYLRQAAVSPRTPLLLRALLVTAVGTVEPLVTRLVRLLMNRAAPQAYSSLADPRLDQQARDCIPVLVLGAPDELVKRLHLRLVNVAAEDAQQVGENEKYRARLLNCRMPGSSSGMIRYVAIASSPRGSRPFTTNRSDSIHAGIAASVRGGAAMAATVPHRSGACKRCVIPGPGDPWRTERTLSNTMEPMDGNT